MSSKEMPPEIAEQVVDLNENDVQLFHAAMLEAMMTYMKRETGAENADRILIMKSVADTKEQIFNFGRVYERTLQQLEAGERDVLPDLRKQFEEKKA